MNSKILLLAFAIIFLAGSVSANWWNEDYAKCMNLNVTGGNQTLTNFVFFAQFNYSSGMSPDFKDIRLINASCNNGGTELPYEFDYVLNNSIAGIWGKSNLNTGINQYSIYYDSDNLTDGQNRAEVWKGAKMIFHFTEFSSATNTSLNSANATRNATFMNNLTNSFGITPFGYGLNFSGTKYLRINSLGNLGTGTLIYTFNIRGGTPYGTYQILFDAQTDGGSGYDWFNTAQNNIDQSDGSGTAYADLSTSRASTNNVPINTIFQTTRAGMSLNVPTTFLVGKYYLGDSNYLNAQIDEIQFWNYTFDLPRINRTILNRNITFYSASAGLTRESFDFTQPDAVLSSPQNNALISVSSVNLTFLAEDDLQLANATLSVYNGTILLHNQTINLSGTYASGGIVYTFANEGTYLWNYKISDTAGNIKIIGNNTITIDLPTPLEARLIQGSGTIYQTAKSGGAGLGVFLQYMIVALPFLLLGILLAFVVLTLMNVLKEALGKNFLSKEMA